MVGVVLIIILGIVSFGNMTVDLLPSMNLPYAIVMTTYPGASPEEVETVVTKPVEQTMATVSNIKNVQSVSNENASTVILEFDQTANMDSVTIEMREGLDQISGFWPDEVTNPIIMKLNPSMMPVLITAVSASGEDAAETTRIIEEQVLPEVESVEGVASVSTAGSIEETVQVTVNEQKVEALNEDVKAALEEKMNEAASALQQAKDQVANGKAALAAGKAQASSGVGEAEAQISQKAEEIKQAQLEITEKMAELNVTDTQLQQSLAAVQASKAAAEAQLTQLKTLKASETQIRSRYAELDAKGTGRTPEEDAELQQLRVQMAQLDNYDTAKAALEATVAQLTEQEASLKEGQGKVTAGRQQLEAVQKQVNNGAMSLAEARGQLASAQVQAAAGLGEGAAQLAAGEAMIQSQKRQPVLT